MPRAEPGLRQELLEAREKVLRQIERLEARPYPMMSGAGFEGAVGLRTNGVMVDNRALIAKLGETLRQLDDCLARLGPEDC